MLRNLIIRWVINALALWFVDLIFDGIWFDSTGSLLITAIVLGLLNAVIKPVLVVFTLPLNILTLGLFTIIINAIILELTDFWVDSFHIQSFGIAILGAIVISLVSVFLQSLLGDEKK
jgi:putative membrane protein